MGIFQGKDLQNKNHIKHRKMYRNINWYTNNNIEIKIYVFSTTLLNRCTESIGSFHSNIVSNSLIQNIWKKLRETI